MCGIAGKIKFKGSIDRTTELPKIKETLEVLRHRGPDDQGYYLDERVWLAATRLAILDLSSAGRMPMSNEEGNLQMVFNGEIYNYLELRKKLRGHRFVSQTDSEVVIHLYEDYGLDCLGFLRGMFALAIWDERKGQLFLARDRIGEKPLKYFFNSQFFIFASEIKAFIEQPGVPKEMDFEAIDEYLTMEYVPSPKTGFKNIYKLPPASYMVVSTNGEISCKRYWELDYSQKVKMSEEEWEEAIVDKLTESVRLRLQSDVPLGIHLSGGVDSGLITAIACQNSKRQLSTFSIGFEDSQFNELPYSRTVADKYKTDHHEIIVQSQTLNYLEKLAFVYEEPFADPSILPTWVLMKESKKEITVALNGDGGDENFAGYDRYRAMGIFYLIKGIPFKKEISLGFEFLNRLYKSKNAARLLKLLRFYDKGYHYFYSNIINSLDITLKESLYSNEFKNIISKTYKENVLVKKFLELPKGLNWLEQLLSIDIKTYLPDNLMVKVDIASMAHSLEVRSPFLDHEFMELTAKMPGDLKLKRFRTKYLLKKIAEKYLPKDCIYRRKQGFVPPLDKWLNLNQSYLRKELLSSGFSKLGLFNRGVISKFLSRTSSTSNYSRIVWRLLCLENWFLVWFSQ